MRRLTGAATSYPRLEKPAGAVIVDRTSRWGSPFTVEDAIAHGLADTAAQARAVV